MKKILLFHLFTWLAALLPFTVTAQSLKMAGYGAMPDEKFQIVYLLDGVQEGGTFNEPSVDGAKFLHKSSPVKIGESTQVIISNGRQVENSSTKTFKYTVTYRLNKTGNLHVGPASVTVGGRKITAPGFSVNVSKQEPQRPRHRAPCQA